MKQIGSEIGVNESRVSQLHARAIRRLRDALGSAVSPMQASELLRSAILAFEPRAKMARATIDSRGWTSHGGAASNGVTRPGVVVAYRGLAPGTSKAVKAVVAAPKPVAMRSRRRVSTAVAAAR